MTVAQALDGKPGDHACSGSDEGVEQRLDGLAVGGSADPALKPNQPNHRMPAPSMTKVRLWRHCLSASRSLRAPGRGRARRCRR